MAETRIAKARKDIAAAVKKLGRERPRYKLLWRPRQGVRAASLGGTDLPELHTRDGVDPGDLILVTPPNLLTILSEPPAHR